MKGFDVAGMTEGALMTGIGATASACTLHHSTTSPLHLSTPPKEELDNPAFSGYHIPII